MDKLQEFNHSGHNFEIWELVMGISIFWHIIDLTNKQHLTQSTAQADGNVFSFADFRSSHY